MAKQLRVALLESDHILPTRMPSPRKTPTSIIAELAASSPISKGTYECKISKLPLPPGQYHFNAMIKLNGTIADHVYAAATVEVLPADFYGIGVATSNSGGLVFADHSWS
jgi:hypothetical protein